MLAYVCLQRRAHPSSGRPVPGSRCRSYPTPWHEKPYLLHLGLQCYDRAFLRQYCRLPPTPLQAGRAGAAGSLLLLASLFAVDGVWHGPGAQAPD